MVEAGDGEREGVDEGVLGFGAAVAGERELLGGDERKKGEEKEEEESERG